jgi:hypothetical protein
MASNWVEFFKTAAPAAGIIGVWVGSVLTRRSSVQTFQRDLVFKEMERRRALGVDYKKAVWAMGARVGTLRGLVHELTQAQKTKEDVQATFNFPDARDRAEILRNAFAELEALQRDHLRDPYSGLASHPPEVGTQASSVRPDGPSHRAEALGGAPQSQAGSRQAERNPATDSPRASTGRFNARLSPHPSSPPVEQ